MSLVQIYKKGETTYNDNHLIHDLSLGEEEMVDTNNELNIFLHKNKKIPLQLFYKGGRNQTTAGTFY